MYGFPNKSVPQFWGLFIGEEGVTHSRTRPLIRAASASMDNSSLQFSSENTKLAVHKFGLTHKFATLSLEQEQELYKANSYYNVPTKGFEYFKVNKTVRGYPELPNLLVLDELVSNLIEKLEPVCLDAT